MAAKGSYALVIDLDKETRLDVGRLGTFEFSAGRYLYMGSALNGLEARVRRHIRREKRLRWHVDYLISVAVVSEVWYALGEERWECSWASIAREHGGRVAAPGFGSSDCRCSAHLLQVGDGRLLAAIRERVAADVGERGLHIYAVRETENSRTFSIRESI